MPTVVIIGRPNVGKSTLFNRIVGSQQAIVEDRPGITRDRKELDAEWLGVPFRVVDTGGWMPGGDASSTTRCRARSKRPSKDADVVLFVVDAAVGLTDDDEQIANWLRRPSTTSSSWPTRPTTNRREDRNVAVPAPRDSASRVPVSALHGRRAGDLLDIVLERLGDKAVYVSRSTSPATVDPDDDDGAAALAEQEADAPRVAIVGRPNVGKSTLFNRLVGADRSVVHDMAGTTRDSIDTLVETEDGPIVFIDTAGMRRKGQASTTRRSTTRSFVPCARSTTPTSRCWSSMRPTASLHKINDSPNASMQRGVRS